MPAHLPKISVVMPFYNASLFLDEAIQSILNQTFDDFEFIIINDASTDNSGQVVKKYLSDKRIVYIENKTNQGIVKNLNYGFKIAKADLVARMDGDDISDTTRLAKQYKFLAQHPEVSAVGTFLNIMNQDGQLIDKRSKPLDFNFIKKNILTYSPIVHAATLFRKESVLKAGGYRSQYLYCEDIDLFYRLVYSGYQISNIAEYLYNYRYHENSVAHQSRLIAKRIFKLRQETIEKFKLHPSFKQQFMMYLQYSVGSIFSGRQVQSLEGIYKIIFGHGK